MLCAGNCNTKQGCDTWPCPLGYTAVKAGIRERQVRGVFCAYQGPRSFCADPQHSTTITKTKERTLSHVQNQMYSFLRKLWIARTLQQFENHWVTENQSSSTVLWVNKYGLWKAVCQSLTQIRFWKGLMICGPHSFSVNIYSDLRGRVQMLKVKTRVAYILLSPWKKKSLGLTHKTRT